MKPPLKPRPALRKLSKKVEIDKSIKHFVDRIRLAGYETFASCSATEADHNPKDQAMCDFSYLSIELPKGVVRYGKCYYIRYSDFRNGDVYHKFRSIGKKSGWFLHFMRRKKYLTPMVNFILYNKRKPSDGRILQAWERLTRNLEKINAYQS